MKTLLILAAVAAIAPVPAVAQASARSQIVSYGDLQLGSPDGRAAVAHRIRHAADEVCGTASAFDLVGQNRLSQCRADAIAVAEQALTRQIAAHTAGATVTVAAR